MKKILSVSAVCLAGLLILLILVLTVFQLVMSGRENWPDFSFGSFFNGEYFARISAYYRNDPSEEETKESDTEKGKDTEKTYETESPVTESDTAATEVPEETETSPTVFFALSQTEFSIFVGSDHYIGAAAYPEDDIDDSLYTAVSSDMGIVAVTVNGAAMTVAGVTVGEGVITVYYDGMEIGKVSVTVTEGDASTETTGENTEDVHPGTEVIRQPSEIDPDRPMLALTFDDGPSKHTEKLLDILKEYNSRATFFMIGKQVSAKKSTLIRMYNEGHDLGIHTWSHANLKKLSLDEIRYEVSSVRDKIEEITGFRTNLVRPPYGAVNDTVKEASRLDEFYLINWNIDTLDWQLRDAQLVYESVMNQAKDGAIILLHDLHKETVEAMETAIPALIAKGYQLVTVTELLSYSDKAPEFGATIRKQ